MYPTSDLYTYCLENGNGVLMNYKQKLQKEINALVYTINE